MTLLSYYREGSSDSDVNNKVFMDQQCSLSLRKCKGGKLSVVEVYYLLDIAVLTTIRLLNSFGIYFMLTFNWH